MDIKELLDEESFDPEKLFNEEEFSTLIINREGFSKKENSVADLLELLLESSTTREQAEEVFRKLKEFNAQDMMVSAIEAAEKAEDRRILIAACWESGLDFSKYFLFFVKLANSVDFQSAMEASTVVEYIETGVPKDIIEEAIVICERPGEKNLLLVDDLLNNLRSRITD